MSQMPCIPRTGASPALSKSARLSKHFMMREALCVLQYKISQEATVSRQEVEDAAVSDDEEEEKEMKQPAVAHELYATSHRTSPVQFLSGTHPSNIVSFMRPSQIPPRNVNPIAPQHDVALPVTSCPSPSAPSVYPNSPSPCFMPFGAQLAPVTASTFKAPAVATSEAPFPAPFLVYQPASGMYIPIHMPFMVPFSGYKIASFPRATTVHESTVDDCSDFCRAHQSRVSNLSNCHTAEHCSPSFFDMRGAKEVYFRGVEPSFEGEDVVVSPEEEEILQHLDQMW